MVKIAVKTNILKLSKSLKTKVAAGRSQMTCMNPPRASLKAGTHSVVKSKLLSSIALNKNQHILNRSCVGWLNCETCVTVHKSPIPLIVLKPPNFQSLPCNLQSSTHIGPYHSRKI